MLRDVHEILAQSRSHHQIKDGIERGRQHILCRAYLAAPLLPKMYRDARPVIVGVTIPILIEKECIEQLFSLRIERFAPCL